MTSPTTRAAFVKQIEEMISKTEGNFNTKLENESVKATVAKALSELRTTLEKAPKQLETLRQRHKFFLVKFFVWIKDKFQQSKISKEIAKIDTFVKVNKLNSIAAQQPAQQSQLAEQTQQAKPEQQNKEEKPEIKQNIEIDQVLVEKLQKGAPITGKEAADLLKLARQDTEVEEPVEKQEIQPEDHPDAQLEKQNAEVEEPVEKQEIQPEVQPDPQLEKQDAEVEEPIEKQENQPEVKPDAQLEQQDAEPVKPEEKQQEVQQDQQQRAGHQEKANSPQPQAQPKASGVNKESEKVDGAFKNFGNKVLGFFGSKPKIVPQPSEAKQQETPRQIAVIALKAILDKKDVEKNAKVLANYLEKNPAQVTAQTYDKVLEIIDAERIKQPTLPLVKYRAIIAENLQKQ